MRTVRRLALALAAVAAALPAASLAADSLAGKSGLVLAPVDFDQLDGFAADDHLAAFQVFKRHCAALLDPVAPLRADLPPPPALLAVCRRAVEAPPRDAAAARRFFETSFEPRRVVPAAGEGFLTGYYEPVVAGSWVRTDAFTAPVLGRPDDLVSFAAGETPPPGLAPDLAAARRLPDGTLAPYPDRAAIETGAIADHAAPLLWLADPIEVFMVQVQGSARVRLPDGRFVRLTYAGRNGQPYTSIGRILVQQGAVAAADLNLAALKAWVRAHGQGADDDGTALMRQNRSYVFFALDPTPDGTAGPVGAAGLPLTPLRSIAVDRMIWAYGLPFFIAAELPWESATPSPFRRLMIAQDTGTAIVGPARVDLFFGSGVAAGARAGDIRHAGSVTVLWPRAAPAP